MCLGTVVDWTPRKCNRETDALADGHCTQFDSALRFPLSAGTLIWSISPTALELGKAVAGEISWNEGTTGQSQRISCGLQTTGEPFGERLCRRNGWSFPVASGHHLALWNRVWFLSMSLLLDAAGGCSPMVTAWSLRETAECKGSPLKVCQKKCGNTATIATSWGKHLSITKECILETW